MLKQGGWNCVRLRLSPAKRFVFSKFLRFKRANWSDWVGVGAIAIASFGTTGLVLGLTELGGLESLELAAFDRMMQWRAPQATDDRLLVVEITEADLAQYGWPLSDADVARLLAKLQQGNPSAIGLDIYRDIPEPPGHEALVKQLQAPNVFGITTIGNEQKEATPPPPSLPSSRVGFNDLPLDRDNVVRRNLLFLSTDNGVLYSFSLQLAANYLSQYNISLQNHPTNKDYIQLNGTTLAPVKSDSGGYATIDNRGFQILLDYRAARNIAPIVTLDRVLSDSFDPNTARDKIVLIGSTAPSLRDLFSTPYSAAIQTNPKMAGVLIHAHMTSQFLDLGLGDRQPFWFWSQGVEAMWVLAWAGFSAIFAWKVNHPVVLGVGGTAIVGAIAATGFQIFLHRGWVPTVSPAIAAILSGGATVAYQAHQAQRQQQIVMKLLGQNTSPEIADALWHSRSQLLKSGKLAGQKLIATTLFTDIKDFSTISEQMPPEALLEWLNEYFAVLTHEVQRHHGIINKFTGDGLMAVFGVPIQRDNAEEIAQDACHAVACGLAFGHRLVELNRNWQQRGMPVVQMRVGIFTGPIVAGSLGGKERIEYGVIGDSVNIASRLESCEKDRQSSICRILIARDTLDYLGDRFEVEHWGPLALKGKQKMVDVYRVLGDRAQPQPDID